MSHRERAVLLTLCIVFAAAAPPWTTPRTAWGDPDLQGVWTSDNNFSIPLERPTDVSDKAFLDGTDLEAGDLHADPPHGRADLLDGDAFVEQHQLDAGVAHDRGPRALAQGHHISVVVGRGVTDEDQIGCLQLV